MYPPETSPAYVYHCMDRIGWWVLMIPPSAATVAAFRRDAGLPDSALLAVPLAGHDLLVDPATGPSASQKAAAWLERRFFSAA